VVSRDKRGVVEQEGIELFDVVETWQLSDIENYRYTACPRDDAGDEEYYSKNNLTSASVGNLGTR